MNLSIKHQKNHIIFFRIFILMIILWACISCKKQKKTPPEKVPITPKEELLEVQKKIPEREINIYYDTSRWYNILDLDPSIQIDIRYATENNFVGEIMYDCGECFLRPEVAKAIVKINKDVKEKGMGGIKIFDCYRPRPYQQRLWDRVPDQRFVSPPSKGSMHTRGAAVDLTLLDKEGNELDMGTDFDSFEKEAYHNFPHEPHILKNRSLLKSMMYKRGFKHISTEWWHYSYTLQNYSLSDWVWECNND